MSRMRLMNVGPAEHDPPEERQDLLVPCGDDALTVIVTGLRGSGKTTLSEGLVSHFKVVRVRAYNTRPIRVSDPLDENVRVTNDEFWDLERKGKILRWTDAVLSEEIFWKFQKEDRMSQWDKAIRYTVNEDGSVYYRATPVLDDWTALNLETEMRLIVCGPDFALEAVRRLPLKNPRVIFLNGSELTLLKRIRSRPRGDDFLAGHVEKNKQHMKSQIHNEFLNKGFMDVISTDGISEKQVLEEAVAFLGEPYTNRLSATPP